MLIEKTTKEKRTPVDYATEYSESIFAKLNKINNNKHIEDISQAWIETSLRDLNNNVLRPRSGKKNDFISEDHKFTHFSFPNDLETQALLEALKKYNYKEQQHWHVDQIHNLIVFQPPPL